MPSVIIVDAIGRSSNKISSKAGENILESFLQNKLALPDQLRITTDAGN
jgi:hypothetical protein